MNYRNRKYILTAFLLLFSFSVTLYSQFPLLINKYAINDDVRHAIYFYSRYQDKELFKDDYITNFYYRWSPWGLNIFYFFVSLIYDPIKFTKILPFFLCIFSTLYIYKIGKLIKGDITGLIAGILFVLVFWSREAFESFSTGDGESFGILLCVMFLFYFFKNNFYKINLIFLLLAIFYPPILLVNLLTYSICLGSKLLKSKKINAELILFTVTAFVIILISLLKYSDGSLRLVGYNTIKTMPEFFSGGRTQVFFSSIYDRLTNPRSGLAFDSSLKFLFFVSFGLMVILKKKALNFFPRFWVFLFASSALFALANVFMIKLYGPSRYVRHPLPFFFIFFISYNIDSILKKIRSKETKAIAILGISIIIFIFFAPKIKRYMIVANQPNLYNFLKTLPKDIFIAGHPRNMDNIPTFAKRKVLINEETSEPYFIEYYPEIKQRTYDFFDAYYSDTVEQINDFCKQYNITHFIIYKQHFSGDYLSKGIFYLSPFNNYIGKLIKNKKKYTFMDKLIGEKIFEDKEVFVIKIEQ